MHNPKPRQPKRAPAMHAQMSHVLREQSTQYTLTLTSPQLLGVGMEKKLKKKIDEIYQKLRNAHVPIELALAVYSGAQQGSLVVGLLACAEADKKALVSVDDEKVQKIISFLFNGEPEKSKEVFRCYHAWRCDPKSSESMNFEFTTDLRDMILDRVDLLQSKKQKNLPVKDAAKFMSYKKSDVKPLVASGTSSHMHVVPKKH